ncbi:virulence factor [Virgibacillus natechei]|uniref:Virulence factor n=1 Tax=Virgibacillus natechei TaxID=1216297 RepID=A0ABS4IDD5_9BACI|nr:Gfo/Idh/MocA family oxidoreductase [Virgibacillus natechei]MBP1968456.1 virulence factor [Virgibacillus natechei]UZD13577.1 Gfo/Idh/MocA family oxidoreductase [Virgibacillus natechei]
MKVGVIGVGNMGENHVRTYLSMQDQCQLVGLYDNDEKKSNQIAKKYNVKPFQSIDSLLQSVDAVSIAVPTEFHYDIGLSCIQHNVHMLMEKPITTTVVQAEDLIQKANEVDIKIQVGHIELFNPLIQFLTKIVENETIIGILFHRMSPPGERVKNVNVVNDLMIHDLYILNQLLPGNVVEFYALGNVVENIPKHAAAIIRYSEGVTAQLTASFKSMKKVRIIQILTEEAFLEADILNREIKITRSIIEDTSKVPVPITQTIQIDDSIQPLRIQLLDFINCITCDTEPFVSGEDGKKALIITNKITESIINHKI